MIQEKKKHRKSKKKPSAMSQVHNRVNAGVMDGVVYGGMIGESRERFETWYRGYKAKYGSDYDHLLWLTDDIDYARSYGNRVEEVILDGAKMNVASIEETEDVGNETDEWFDYIDGPSEELALEMLRRGFSCYCFEANDDSSYCMCLWDKSVIVSRRELSREEFDKIEGYEGYDNPAYDADLNEAAEPEDEEYEIGMEEGGPEPYAHVVNENTDYIPSLHLGCNDFDAIPFICFKKKDGDSTKVFVGARSELHSAMPAALFSNGELKRSDFGNSLWDVKRDEKRSGRLWLPDDYQDYSVISFYSYYDTPTQIYGQCWDVLPTLQHELDDTFSTGKMVVDLWTHAKGRADVLMPLRWFNNGTAEVYLPYVQSCVPVKSSLTDEIVFKLETTKGRFVLDWYGDDVADGAGFGLAENKKTMYITEEQMKVLLENEGTNIKRARKYLESRRYSPEQRQKLLDSIRTDIPNSRLLDCKFILGVTRLYVTGELYDAQSIFQLNRTLKYIASPAHSMDYDNNLNGESLETLVQRFGGVATADLQQSIEASNARQLTANNDYTIVPINCHEDARKYAAYFPDDKRERWCVTYDKNMFDSYTQGGVGRFYFCLRRGFENEPHVAGEGCPLDSYGLSMIAVSVTSDGAANTITCRWNHTNGASDNVMTVEELENVVGRNFYQTFKPFSDYEIFKLKGMIEPEKVQEFLDNGVTKEELFDNRIYKLEPFGLYLVKINSPNPNYDYEDDNPDYWYTDGEGNYYDYDGNVIELEPESIILKNIMDESGKLILPDWSAEIKLYRVGHIARVSDRDNKSVKYFDLSSRKFITDDSFHPSSTLFPAYTGWHCALVFRNTPRCEWNCLLEDGTYLLDKWTQSQNIAWAAGRKQAMEYSEVKGQISEATANENKKTMYITEEQIKQIKALLEEKGESVDYNKYIKSLINFMREQHLRVDPLPKIELNPEEQDGIFVKTGYYSPDERKVVVFTDGRHPKDVLRTVAHEFIHHMQNLQNPDKDWGTGGDLEADSKLRSIEGEAFLLGNIIFREWTEKMKKTKKLNESKKRKKQVKNDKGEIVPETCDKCGGKVVCQIHGEPVYVCKDCGKYFGTMPCTLNEIASEIVEPDDVDLSSFNIKKHLNPKFWDDGHLDTRIRLKLLDIADDFFDSLGVDWVEPEDVVITGSLANYNWNKKYSDIDLHVLVDYEDVDERVDFVREYFTMKKNEWNEKHKNLRIFGFPVEVYVQDANEPHASSGVYSIDRDEWITEPDIEKIRSGKVDKKHVREMVSTYMNKIDCLVDIYKSHKDDEYEMRKVAEDATEMFDEIKKLRKDDLAKYGREMCDGNIIFKALRRSDYIGKLITLKNLTYDKINSM